MPAYEYKCTGSCEELVVKVRGIKEDDPGYECESCTLPLERVYSNVGAVFNGSGFYSTDNRKKQTMTAIAPEKSVDNSPKEWILGPKDRCDSCNAEALVNVKGVSGELLFCGHHYNKIMNDKIGYEKMMAFMYEIIDEREKLIQNKLKDEDYV